MTRERWQRVQDLFYAAEGMDRSRRQAFLEQACADDPELRKQVERLIEDAEKSGDFIERAVNSAASHIAEEPVPALERIGPYRIIRRIGRGGMGTVYLASRDDEQYEKQVAIKLLRMGFDDPRMLRRFRAERQILATLDHPNIARLLDGGTTPQGVPYVVMDYVDGVPIDEYCTASNLPVTERLKLFRTVCDAVEYAHRNLIVHRDIKPANLLVTADGVPKLLDFGIAKLLADDERALTAAERPMTPEYASPEQIRGEMVTTATDVHGLGLLLYILLTGQHPFRVRKPGVEQEPEKPSSSVLSNRKLSKQLAGDLDTIVLTALRNNPAQRYGSAAHLSEDIQRYLNGFPIQARQENWVYRSGKFVRRHKTPVGAAVIFVLLLAGFAISMSVLAKRLANERDVARREREKAEQVSRFLEDAFRVSDPNQARGNTVTAREILDRGAGIIQKELESQPEVQATLMGTMGRVYQNLGLYDRSAALLRQALATQQRLSGERSLETARAQKDLAEVLRVLNDYRGAEALARESLATRQALLGVEHVEIADSMNTLGLILYEKGDSKGAEVLYRKAITIRQKIQGPDHPDVTVPMYNLVLELQQRGDLAGATALVRQVLAIRRKTLGDDHPRVALSMNRLAQLLNASGQYEESEALFRQVLVLRRKLFGPDHPDVASTMNDLASLLQDRGDYTNAESFYRQALAIHQKAFGEESREVAVTMNNLASLLEEKEDYADAEGLYRHSLEIRRKLLGEEHPMVARSMANLGRLLTAKGDFSHAEPLLRQSLALRRKIYGEKHSEVAFSLFNLAKMFEAKDDFPHAEMLFRQSVEKFRVVLRPGTPQIADAVLGLGSFQLKRGNSIEAEPLLREAVEIRRKILGENQWKTAEAESTLGACLLARKNYAEGETLLVHALSVLNGPRPKQAALAKQRLAGLYDSWQKPEKAALYKE